MAAPSSPRKKHTRTVVTSSGSHEKTSMLPPLDINRTTLHSHHTRRSARKSSRGHTVPAMMLTPSKATGSMMVSGKRSHSAISSAQTPEGGPGAAAGATPVDHGHHGSVHVPASPSRGRKSRNGGHHVKTGSHHQFPSSPERKSKVLCTPDRMAGRRGQILNKIETVRVLRARPAFYPIAERGGGGAGSSTAAPGGMPTMEASASSSAKSSSGKLSAKYSSSGGVADLSSGGSIELPHNIMGKHITLHRSEMKRKRRALALPPPSPTPPSAANFL